MSYYFPTQEEIDILNQTEKEIHVKIELLNKKFQVIDFLEGNLQNDSFNISADSLQRRSYSCTLVVTDSSFTIGPNNKVFIDKYIRVYYGLLQQKTKKVWYWRIGTFTFVDPSYSYSAADSTLSLECADLMADYDGTKNGQLVGTHSIGEYQTEEQLKLNMSYTFRINAVAEYEKDSQGNIKYDDYGVPIVKSYMKMRDAILATLRLAGIPESRYYVQDYTTEDQTFVPYDLEFTAGTTYADIWSKLCEIYPNWQFFFDKDGKFIWQRIPTGYGFITVLNNDIIDPLLISETQDCTFKEIYNATEVWGKNLELTLSDRYAESSTYSASTNTYSINLPLIAGRSTDDPNDINTYFDNWDKIAFIASASNTKKDPYLQITGNLNGKGITFPKMKITDSSRNSIAAGTISEGHVHVFTFRRDYINNAITNYMVHDGRTQCYGYYEETNPNCPYSVTSLGYRIPNRITMETDYTDDICFNRAERMTYESCAMKDSISLNMITVPWLDVNQKIKYVSKFSPNREKELQVNTPEYMITGISWSSFDGTMTLNAYRFREDFEYVWARRYQDEDETPETPRT